MTSEDGRSVQAEKGDGSSVKSESVEVTDDDDDDDMGISFTAAVVTSSAHEGKYCLDMETTTHSQSVCRYDTVLCTGVC